MNRSGMFLRFTCATGDGLFQRASALVESASGPDRADLEEVLAWFSAKLAVPDRFVRTTSKGYRRRETVAICWFKAGAKEHLRQAWRIVRVLERNGVSVELVRTGNPGYVTYEDDDQVAAIPFADR